MKKLISIILAACMCLSLIGGVSFAAAEDTVEGSYTYSFVAGTGNCPKKVSNEPLWDYTDYTVLPYCFFDADEIIKGFIECSEAYIAKNGTIPVYNSTDKTPPEDAAKYTFEYEENTGSVVLGDFYTRLLCFNGTDYFRFRTITSIDKTSFPKGRWVAIKLDARELKEGTYDITFKSNGTYLRYCEVYLAPYDSSKTSGEDYMEGQEPIFKVEGVQSEITRENFDVIGDADEYVLIIKQKKAIETRLTSITFTPVSDSEYAAAFKESDSEEVTYAPSVNPYAYAKDGSDIGASVTATDKDEDGVYTLTAPETAGEDDEYKFIYWAKGLTTGTNRQVVSTSATYTDYVPQNGKNYVIAVYDKAGAGAKAEFYNANGQLITTLTENGNAPALPYMAGYGQASNWALHGTSTKISGGDLVALSGNMIFFAEYDTSKPDKFEIIVNGKKGTYTYGQKVECKAELKDASGNVFFGWKKTVNGTEQLVSTDNNYTFYAWETCTVTPVYKERAALFDGEKKKVILGTFTLGGEQVVMAEYFGFDEADEKGIVLSTAEGASQEIAMTSDNNQFTVVNNEGKTGISGYAILNGMKYIYSK